MRNRITLSETEGVRYLHFGTEWVQGAMRIARPWRIELEYQRRMMAALLFTPAPRDIVQLGLGAAALTRACWKHIPRARVTAVELDPAVIATAHQSFRLPPPDARLRLVQGDAREFLGEREALADWLQVDLYDAQARGPVHDDEAFYLLCKRALRPGGVAVFNVFGGRSFARSARAIDAAFDGHWLRMVPTMEGNAIVYAWRDEGNAPPTLATAKRRAASAARAFGFDTSRWLDEMRDGEGVAPYR